MAKEGKISAHSVGIGLMVENDESHDVDNWHSVSPL